MLLVEPQLTEHHHLVGCLMVAQTVQKSREWEFGGLRWDGWREGWKRSAHWGWEAGQGQPQNAVRSSSSALLQAHSVAGEPGNECEGELSLKGQVDGVVSLLARVWFGSVVAGKARYLLNEFLGPLP